MASGTLSGNLVIVLASQGGTVTISVANNALALTLSTVKLGNSGALISSASLSMSQASGWVGSGTVQFPGGTLIMAAHRELESLTLDRSMAHYKQKLALDYAEMVYNGLWFTPLREALDAVLPRDLRLWMDEARLQRIRWRRDGVARFQLQPVAIDAAMPVFTPDDLMAGQLPVVMNSIGGTTIPTIRSGKVRALAVTGIGRNRQLAEFPNVTELLPGEEPF